MQADLDFEIFLHKNQKRLFYVINTKYLAVEQNKLFEFSNIVGLLFL